jgi:glucosamine-6-phosphate deaminase
LEIIEFKNNQDLIDKFILTLSKDLGEAQVPSRVDLATGATFVEIYKALSEKIKSSSEPFKVLKSTKFSSVDELLSSSFNLQNKTLGVFANTLRREFLQPSGIYPENWIMPGCISKDEKLSPKNILNNANANIKKYGPSDWVFLGVGPNGHVAFNEPGSVKNKKDYKIQRLYRNSSDRLGLGRDEAGSPRLAITLTINGILKAKKIYLVVNSLQKKLKPVKQFMNSNRETTLYPLTYLKKHKDLKLFVQEI